MSEEEPELPAAGVVAAEEVAAAEAVLMAGAARAVWAVWAVWAAGVALAAEGPTSEEVPAVGAAPGRCCFLRLSNPT